MQVNKVNSSPSFGLIMPPVYLEKAPEVVPAIIQKVDIQKVIPTKKALVTSDFVQSQMPNWFKNKEAIVADSKIRLINEHITKSQKRKVYQYNTPSRNTGRTAAEDANIKFVKNRYGIRSSMELGD